MTMLKKNELISVLEKIKVSKDDTVWLHHPITQDLVSAIVVKATADKVLLNMPKGSPYFGQPDFYIKKMNIIGKK